MKTLKPFVLTAAATVLAACSFSKEQPKLDYQSQSNKIVNLEVPPDLHDPRQGDVYSLPEGTTANPNALSEKTAGISRVLADVKNAHIERHGNQRWLVVGDKTAAQIWPLLRVFWQENGFTISSEEPGAGLMETDWAENRAKLPNQGLRKLFDIIGMSSIYTTSERDKFLIRVEHNEKGGVDIFFTHKGLEEVYTDKKEDTAVWQPRAGDPNLEAAFLARFMQYLGVDEAAVRQQIQVQNVQQQGTEFARMDNGSVWVAGALDRNINRVGAALDRIGLTVQQYVSERNMFVVRPAPAESDAVSAAESGGILARWFGFGKKAEQPKEQAAQLFVALEESGDGQRIRIFDQMGKPYTGNELQTWYHSLYRELR